MTALRTDLDWMTGHVACLFTQDARGRLLRTNEPEDSPAPRFYLGRTALGNLWRLHADLSTSAVRALARLAAREAPIAARPVAPERAAAFLAVLERDCEIGSPYAGPAFRFPDPLPSLDLGANLGANLGAGVALLPIGPAEARLLEPEFPWLPAELGGRMPCVAAVVEGRAVSVCFTARGGAAGETGRMLEAGVNTAPSHRGRGLACRVVSAWARQVTADDCFPLYSTSWDNHASQAGARRLGLLFYGEDFHYTAASFPATQRGPEADSE